MAKPAPNLMDMRGDWIKSKRLGSGAFGTVFMWQNVLTEERIAIKSCKIENRDTRNRWQQEMKMIECMHHPNIVAFIQIPDPLCSEYPRHSSLGMEYCDRGDLRKFLSSPKHCCGLPEYHILDIMCDVGSAIKYLHDNKNMHRDLKPENIVLKSRPQCDGRFQFKVTDLGYAKVLADVSFANSFVGTLAYLAPEVARVQLPYGDHRYYTQVDYWSFGLVVFECIAGIRPLTTAHAEKKDDDHICFLPDNDGKLIFQKIIPQPHSLNPYIENDIVRWLKLMLCADERKRGGGDEWHKLLMEKIAPAKYVKVLDVASMTMKTFPIDQNTPLHYVQVKIEEELKIARTDQLLLLDTGEVPKATGKLLPQIIIHNNTKEQKEPIPRPEYAVIFLFHKSLEEWPNYKSKSPSHIVRYFQGPEDSRSRVLTELQHKRFFNICAHDTLSKINTGLLFQEACFAIIRKVDKVSNNLREIHNSFSQTYHKTVGMLELFKASLSEDVASHDGQDNSSGICANEDFSKQCTSMEQSTKEWETELKSAAALICDASVELRGRETQIANTMPLHKFGNDLQTMSNLTEKFCMDFRSELKKIDDRQLWTSHQKFEAKSAKVGQFVRDFWMKTKNLVEEALKPSNDIRRMMRFFVGHCTKLESIFFKITGKTQDFEIMQKNISEGQKERQRSLWIMLQYMKDVYNTAVQYEKDEKPSQDLDKALHMIDNFTQEFINDTDFHALMALSEEISVSQTTSDAASVASNGEAPLLNLDAFPTATPGTQNHDVSGVLEPVQTSTNNTPGSADVLLPASLNTPAEFPNFKEPGLAGPIFSTSVLHPLSTAHPTFTTSGVRNSEIRISQESRSRTSGDSEDNPNPTP